MAATDYDAMAEDEPVTEELEDTGAEDAADDDEFMMAAEEAGFTGEKAKAFWRAVARCVELTNSGGLPMPEEPLPEEDALV